MMNQVTITINKELYNKFIEDDYKAIEKVGALVYEAVYQEQLTIGDGDNKKLVNYIYNIEMNTDKNKQYGEGDFIVIFTKEAKKGHKTVEVKKATIHNGIIKGVLDIRYLTKDLLQAKEQGIHGDKGWMLTLLSDELMFHIVSEGKIYYYIIKNFQTIKENLVNTLYMDDRKYNLMNSYGKELRNNCYTKANEDLEERDKPYNYYIQPDPKKDDEIFKQTLCLALHLDKYFSGLATRCNLDVIEVNIQIE